MRLFKKCATAAVLASIPIVFMTSACSSTGVFVGDPPMSRGGPPPHAPAHGYRAKHTYHYYPEAQVYFDTGRNVYFYLNADGWRMAVSLPASLRLQLADHVTIQMDSDRPYLNYDEHRQKYPPGQMKKTGRR